ncbi:pin domain-like protein [Stemphylium lycopersici]|nr:pin domain-like protein [Stemphylium lycopersici]
MHRVRMLIHFGVTPYLVFDGDNLPSKAGTEKDRRERRKEGKRLGLELLKVGKVAQAQQELQKSVDVTPEMARMVIEELKQLKIQYVVAPYEADSQLAYLERKGIINGVLSEDSDLLVFGVKCLITKLDKYGECVEVNRNHFTACREVSFVGWSDADFRKMAILSGCDYLPGIGGLGLKTAHRMLRKHKTVDRLVKAAQFDGKLKVPAGFMAAFDQAEKTFLYQWVYCPVEEKLVNLTPLGEGVNIDDMPYIGEEVPAHLATGVARGDLYPRTKLPMNIAGNTRPSSQPLPASRRSSAAMQTPDAKGMKPIDSFFKARRTPLAELSPNVFTPSPSQQTLLEQQRNTNGWAAVPAPISRLQQQYPPPPSTAPQPRRTTTDPTGGRSVPHPSKRQRLCSDVGLNTSTVGGEDVVRSQFFTTSTPEASPTLHRRKKTRRRTEQDFELYSDDSIQESMAVAADLEETASQSKKKLRVFSDVQSSIGSESQSTVVSRGSTAQSQETTGTLTPASSHGSPEPESVFSAAISSQMSDLRSKFTYKAPIVPSPTPAMPRANKVRLEKRRTESCQPAPPTIESTSASLPETPAVPTLPGTPPPLEEGDLKDTAWAAMEAEVVVAASSPPPHPPITPAKRRRSSLKGSEDLLVQDSEAESECSPRKPMFNLARRKADDLDSQPDLNRRDRAGRRAAPTSLNEKFLQRHALDNARALAAAARPARRRQAPARVSPEPEGEGEDRVETDNGTKKDKKKYKTKGNGSGNRVQGTKKGKDHGGRGKGVKGGGIKKPVIKKGGKRLGTAKGPKDHDEPAKPTRPRRPKQPKQPKKPKNPKNPKDSDKPKQPKGRPTKKRKEPTPELETDSEEEPPIEFPSDDEDELNGEATSPLTSPPTHLVEPTPDKSKKGNRGRGNGVKGMEGSGSSSSSGSRGTTKSGSTTKSSTKGGKKPTKTTNGGKQITQKVHQQLLSNPDFVVDRAGDDDDDDEDMMNFDEASHVQEAKDRDLQDKLDGVFGDENVDDGVEDTEDVDNTRERQRWSGSLPFSSTCELSAQSALYASGCSILPNTYEEQHDILNEFFKMKYIFGYHPQGDPQTVTILHTDPFRSPAERIMTWSRFCIIPSEDSQEDWRRESMTMKDVYANSICNIAASASTDPEGGLFRIRNPDDAASGLVKGSLAPRVVYFANDQVFWECFNELKCERFPHGIPLGHSSKRLLRKWMDLAHSNGELELCSDRVFFHWSDLVNSYSRCELTNESDRLIALSGLVQIFQDFTGDEYLAGLWRQNLREHLAWNTTTLAPGSVSRSMHPSWSWASVTGPISTYEAVQESRQHFAIVDVQMQSSKLDSDDHAISGSIMINGIMLQATCYLTEERSGNVRISSLLADFPMFTDVLDHGIENGSTVACLVMGTRPKESRTRVIDTNMSLMLLASVSSQPNTYRRIGYKWVQEHLWKDKLGLALTEEGIEITGEDDELRQVTPAYAVAIQDTDLFSQNVKDYQHILLNASHTFPSALKAAVGLGRIHKANELLKYLLENVPRERHSGSWQEMRAAARSIKTALRMAIRMNKNGTAAELIKFFSNHDVFTRSLPFQDDSSGDLMCDCLVYGNSEHLVKAMTYKKTLQFDPEEFDPSQTIQLYEEMLRAVFSRGHKRLIRSLVRSGQMTPSHFGKGLQNETPLLLALAHDRHGMVDILLDLGADVNGMTKEKHPRTALQHAASTGSVAYVLLLLEHGANLDHPRCNFLIEMTRRHGSSYDQRKDIWKLYEAEKGKAKENYGVICRWD